MSNEMDPQMKEIYVMILKHGWKVEECMVCNGYLYITIYDPRERVFRNRLRAYTLGRKYPLCQ